jgi:hypothetical protein
MHDLDPVFRVFTADARLDAVARDLGLSDPKVWQSMYIFKQPGIGGEIRWHQDATYFDSDPVSVTTFWFALEDATLENGCMWAEPGGHRGPMRERFLRNGDDVRMEKLSDMPWPDDSVAVPLECKAGTWSASTACCRTTARRTARRCRATPTPARHRRRHRLLAAQLDTTRRQAARCEASCNAD